MSRTRSIRPRIAALAAGATLAILSTVGSIGYVAAVKAARQSQLVSINVRLDALEQRLASGDLMLSSQLDLDTSLFVIRNGESPPPQLTGTLRVVRPSNIAGVESVAGVVSTRQIDDTFESLRYWLWISIAGAGLLVGIIAWVVVDRSLAPVRRLTRQARTIEAGSSDELLDVSTRGDELSELAATFNEMITKLRTADSERRRFVSDASHELRTPLMVLLADAEYAADDPTGGEAQTVLAASVTKQVGRLDSLVHDLLTLAALDEGQAVDSSVTVHALMDSVEDRQVTIDLPSHLADLSVPDVSRALSNVVANAERHAHSQVELLVEMNDAAQTVSIHVDDDGPGLPANERSLVFGRFYRPDDGRTRPDGGAGLGLAIADAEVDRGGGTIAFGESPLDGARVTIAIPLLGCES